jgi:hypothetical protein
MKTRFIGFGEKCVYVCVWGGGEVQYLLTEFAPKVGNEWTDLRTFLSTASIITI